MVLFSKSCSNGANKILLTLPLEPEKENNNRRDEELLGLLCFLTREETTQW